MTAVAEPKSDTQQISLLTQMVRFIVVGGFSALVDFGVYNLCLHVFALDAAAHGADISRAISFICGTTTAYLLNRRWTFNADDHSKAWAFTVLYVITFFVAVGVNRAALNLLPEALWQYKNVAWVISQGTATVVNFVVLRTVVYRAK